MFPYIIAGGAVLGAYLYTRNAVPKDRFSDATVCSARQADASARAAGVEEDVQDEPTGSVFANTDLWSSENVQEIEAQLGSSVPKGAQSSKVKQALREVEPVFVDLLNSREIGQEVLVAGRGKQTNNKPKATGGCLFNQTESYAEAIQQQMAN